MTQAVQTAQLGNTNPAWRNRIINGAMMIDQRNQGAASTAPAAGAGYTLDRWRYASSQVSKVTLQQNQNSVTPPAGFSNYLGITSSSAYSVLSSDFFLLQQKIEGFNVADLGWGTSNAQTIVLSFKVYSSLTGTFGGAIQNSAQDRNYVFSYSVPAANTWTTVSIPIAGDTTGTWLKDSGVGISVIWGLGVGATYSGTAGSWGATTLFSATGATSVVGTNGATFYITGVQLEVGTTATSFEFRDYGRELIMCQRYYQVITGANNGGGIGLIGRIYAAAGGNGVFLNLPYAVTMRASPTTTAFGTWNTSNCSSPTAYGNTANLLLSGTSVTSGDAYFYAGTSATGATSSAEL